MAFYRCGTRNNAPAENFATGEFDNANVTNGIKITCGFRPKMLVVYAKNIESSSPSHANVYDESKSTTNQWRSVTGGGAVVAIGYNNTFSIKSINNDGFTYRGYNNASQVFEYIAVR